MLNGVLPADCCESGLLNVNNLSKHSSQIGLTGQNDGQNADEYSWNAIKFLVTECYFGQIIYIFKNSRR